MTWREFLTEIAKRSKQDPNATAMAFAMNDLHFPGQLDREVQLKPGHTIEETLTALTAAHIKWSKQVANNPKLAAEVVEWTLNQCAKQTTKN